MSDSINVVDRIKDFSFEAEINGRVIEIHVFDRRRDNHSTQISFKYVLLKEGEVIKEGEIIKEEYANRVSWNMRVFDPLKLKRVSARKAAIVQRVLEFIAQKQEEFNTRIQDELGMVDERIMQDTIRKAELESIIAESILSERVI